MTSKNCEHEELSCPIKPIKDENNASQRACGWSTNNKLFEEHGQALKIGSDTCISELLKFQCRSQAKILGGGGPTWQSKRNLGGMEKF